MEKNSELDPREISKQFRRIESARPDGIIADSSAILHSPGDDTVEDEIEAIKSREGAHESESRVLVMSFMISDGAGTSPVSLPKNSLIIGMTAIVKTMPSTSVFRVSAKTASGQDATGQGLILVSAAGQKIQLLPFVGDANGGIMSFTTINPESAKGSIIRMFVEYCSFSDSSAIE